MKQNNVLNLQTPSLHKIFFEFYLLFCKGSEDIFSKFKYCKTFLLIEIISSDFWHFSL